MKLGGIPKSLIDGIRLPADGATPPGSRSCGIFRARSNELGCLEPKLLIRPLGRWEGP